MLGNDNDGVEDLGPLANQRCSAILHPLPASPKRISLSLVGKIALKHGALIIPTVLSRVTSIPGVTPSPLLPRRPLTNSSAAKPHQTPAPPAGLRVPSLFLCTFATLDPPAVAGTNTLPGPESKDRQARHVVASSRASSASVKAPHPTARETLRRYPAYVHVRLGVPSGALVDDLVALVAGGRASAASLGLDVLACDVRRMESQLPFASRDDLWRLQESLNEIATIQEQHTERIMRLEKRRDDDARVKSVWAPTSPYPVGLGGSGPPDSTLNPAAEAFRNFDADPLPGLTSSFSLDNDEDRRRGAASRANSVRFDESANNHYGSTPRQSIELPPRTGSGLGSHPLSERSLSHRSDGRGSSLGLSHRTNSFGLEQSRLLASINNSPRVSGNPPPGFFVLGPCPSIIRCWLTETFSHDSLLYAAVCTGSCSSTVGTSLIHSLCLGDQMIEENGIRKIKLPVYLTEAKIHQASSRSASPAPQVPTLTAKFLVTESSAHDKSIQIVLGSDVLRAHNADLLLSQDKLMIFDEDRNQLAVPLVRPENDAVYKYLATSSISGRVGASPGLPALTPGADEDVRPPGVIGQPARLMTQHIAPSPMTSSPNTIPSAPQSDILEFRKPDQDAGGTARSSSDQPRQPDDAKSATSSEKSFHTPTPKSTSGVWGSSWRASSTSSSTDPSQASKTASAYSRAGTQRNMKVLRPSGKSMSNAARASSSTVTANGVENQPQPAAELTRRASHTSAGEVKLSAPTKSNPIGQASAFPWLKSGQPARALANGD